MRRARYAAAAAFGLLAIGATVPACATKVVGQIVLVIQTDLSLPKDIDTIRIEVSNEGVPKFKNDYDRLGSKDGKIRLPGTLALDAPENPSDAISIVVSARTGGKDGTVRVVREVVTTVPPGRSAELDLPIEFLCDGSGKVENGNAVTTCAEGETCIAGKCVDRKIDSSTLPDYLERRALGDGSCFDVTTCFDDGAIAALDLTSCTIPPTPGVNVALQTEGEGICGAVGCFVALDAQSATGFVTAEDGTITLPPAVCEKIATGTIVNVVTAPVSSRCAQKTSSLPTCGPWSSAANNPEPTIAPVALAGGQSRPVSLVLGQDGVYWTSGGAAGNDGTIKSVSLAGGAPTVLVPSITPREVALKGDAMVWTSAPPGNLAGAVMQQKGGAITPLVEGLDAPEGLMIFGNKIFFTEFKTGGIYRIPLGGGAALKLAQGNYPFRIVADPTHVYWTNEGTAGQTPANGSVARYDYAQGGVVGVETIGGEQETPRAIALALDGGGAATAVYWANFSEQGSIMRVDLGGATPSAPVTVASGLAYPNGITVDADKVYWTNRGDGTVMALAKTAPAGEKPTVLASFQNAPGTIVTDDAAIYWVNEGASDAPNGAVVRLLKSP
jgi:sugar lactone lactonase YvrE